MSVLSQNIFLRYGSMEEDNRTDRLNLLDLRKAQAQADLLTAFLFMLEETTLIIYTITLMAQEIPRGR